MINKYKETVETLLEKVVKEEEKAIRKASSKIAEAVEAGGIIQCFGSGHSMLFGEELFYRAGGLAPVKPVWVEEVLLQSGGAETTRMERSMETAQKAAAALDICSRDVLLIFSASGRNPVVVETAMEAKRRGTFVIAMTSPAYSEKVASRHPSGLNLYETADLILDTKTAAGDAVLQHDLWEVPFGPVSGILGMFIVNTCMAGAIQQLIDSNGEAPVFLSGNLDGSDEWNQSLIDTYAPRIPALQKRERN